MFSCKKPECLEQVILHALTHSNISQAKIRGLHPGIDVDHCERCDEIACYQVVPVSFKEE